MTHEAPSVTGQNCSVGEKTDSKSMGQGLRRGNEHIDIFRLRAPHDSSGSLTVSTGFGLIGKWKCEENARERREWRKEEEDKERGEETERSMVIPFKFFKSQYRISFSCSGSVLEQTQS